MQATELFESNIINVLTVFCHHLCENRCKKKQKKNNKKNNALIR